MNTHKHAARRIGSWGAGAAVLAAVVNVLIHALGRAADVSFLVPGPGSTTPDTTVTAGMVVFMSVVPLLLGVAVAAGAAALGRDGFVRALRVITVVLVAVSMLPLLGDGIGGATALLLGAMHVVVGAAYLGGLVLASRSTATLDRTRPVAA